MIAELYAQSPFATATLWDYLDIFLLTYVLYRGLLVIRGTRGQQIFIGLVLLVVVYGFAKLAGLPTMSWVLDHLAVYVALAMLILFQEDIRNALARAGGSVFRSGEVGTVSDANLMEEVIKAVFSLAHRKIGALIALERNGSLNPYWEGSHRLNALVSTELLQSIFHPSSPLHDGAVVIARRRLAAAGVFVPISLSKEISRAYGTRHRAAIGLTEKTDAICLVVSEERGTVALVKDGSVIPVADANDLRQLLIEKLEESAQPESEVASA